MADHDHDGFIQHMIEHGVAREQPAYDALVIAWVNAVRRVRVG